MNFYPKKILKTTFILLAALCFTLAAALFAVSAPAETVFAGDNDYTVFLPYKTEEYYGLNSPIHAYSDGEITAITENDKKLIISYNGGAPQEIVFADDLGGQIARFGDYLIYRKSQTMYGIKIDDTAVKPELKYIDSLSTPTTLTCYSHYYYENGETRLFAASVENKLRVYDVVPDDDGKPVFLPKSDLLVHPVTINDTSAVTINGSGVFYINVDGRLCRRKIDNLLQSPDEYFTDIIPTSSMIADDEFIYYVSGTKIYRLTINDVHAAPQELSFDGDDYDLGKVNTPKGLSFKGDNLLITNFSANGSVQEFKVNGNALEFTGYAIASGLSAYNRVAVNASDIERYGKFVAALDDYKLTVIDTENCADYGAGGFINRFVGGAPDCFALGNGTIMYLIGGAVKIENIESGEPVTVDTGISATALCDITYQSGNYYVAYAQGVTTTVVKIDETAKTVVGTTVFDKAANATATDVFGNIYVADNAYVYKNTIAASYAIAGATKLATDLAGDVFALAADGKIYKLDQTTGLFSVALDVTGTLGTIKTFGLNFDKGELCFLINGRQEIYYATDAHNLSLEDVVPTAEFNAATAHLTELKVYTVSDTANVYSVSENGGAFDFNGLRVKAEEYPLIAEINVAVNVTLCALASENGVVLINGAELTEKAVTDLGAPEKAFLTTAVSAYALPVIERNGLFAIKKDGGAVRLGKGVEITPVSAFSVLGKTFYQATVKTDGEDLACYIPADFTATVLAENFGFENYSVEKVRKTALYKNADLTEELFELSENTAVKVLENKDGVLKVAAEKNGGVVVGYISEKSLIVKPDTIVRNVLIILAVFGSLAGTISFFLLRKKK